MADRIQNAEINVPIACGGVAVFPNDVVVADSDGAVLIPADVVDAVIEAGLEQERLEGWFMQEVGRGVPLAVLPSSRSKCRAHTRRNTATAGSATASGGASAPSSASSNWKPSVPTWTK